MKLSNWLNKWELTSLKINAQFLELEVKFNNADKNAAWEMYVELLTRITTQHLEPESGDEATALRSIHSIFATTREILKKHGKECVTFSKIAIVVLNQIIRPFTAKWHKKSVNNAFEKPDECAIFREELAYLQKQLRNYTKLLSDIAGVEDLTDLEKDGDSPSI
jgi:hypothetical protein